MTSRLAIQTVTSLLFGGLLLCTWWLDHRADTGVAESGARFGFRLVESAAEAGVEFQHHQTRLHPSIANVEPHVAALGAAVSIVDVNADGWPDIYATSSAAGTPNALFLNQRDGSFRDVAAAAGLADLSRDGEGACMGAVWGDIDNDGDEDLYVIKWGYAQLFRNDGDLTFTDITAEAGLRRWMNSNGAVWFDYDRDGLLDLYVCGYFPEVFDLWNLTTTRIMHESFEFALNGGHNVLWHNLGNGRFEDVTDELSADSTRWTLAVASADFDGDGWQDLYLANDYGPEELMLNQGGKGFSIGEVGIGEDSKSGMAVALGDVRNEGRLDVFVTNISKDGYLFQGNNLRLNLLADYGMFDNMADGVVADCGWAWGAQFADLDNDGDLDLYVVNGFVSGDPEQDYWYDMSKISGAAGDLFQDTRNWPPIGTRSLSGYERSRVLLHQDGNRFIDVAGAVGIEDRYDGRSVATADLFNRGARDVIVANQNGPLLIYRTEPPAEHAWIGFSLEGSASNRSAIGAQVTVHWNGRLQASVVDGGSGFASQNDRRLHFGLGLAESVERAVIRWPSGREQVLDAPAIGRIHDVREAD
jgi:hypothetical protein